MKTDFIIVDENRCIGVEFPHECVDDLRIAAPLMARDVLDGKPLEACARHDIVKALVMSGCRFWLERYGSQMFPARPILTSTG